MSEAMKITQADKDAWLKKLRDPESIQVFGNYGDEASGSKEACAMGFLKLVMGRRYYDNVMDSDKRFIVQGLNDDAKWSLPRIANWVEKNIDAE